MRMKGDGHNGAEALDLLQELCRIYNGMSDPPLTAYRGYGGGQVRTRGQKPHCLRLGLSVVTWTWEREEEVGKSRLA